MTSIRKQVFEYTNTYPDKTLKEVQKQFKTSPKETIRTYYRQSNGNTKTIPLDIKTELIKIVKDKREPGSTKVSAMRFYKELEESPESSEDSSLKLYNTILEKRSLEKKN